MDAGRDAGVITRQLKDLSQSVRLANLTKKAFEDLEEAIALLDNKNYLEATEKLKSVESISNKAEFQDDEDSKQSMKAIRKEHDFVKQKVAYVLGKDWDENVKIVPHFEDGTEDKLLSTTLEFKFQPTDTRLKWLVQAMSQSDILLFRQTKFSQRLFTYILKPIVTRKTRLEEGNSNSFILHVDQESEERPNPVTVLEDFEIICRLLFKYFDFCLSDNQHFLSKIGSQICKPSVDLLMKECLMPAVPDKKDEFEGYFPKITTVVKSFHTAMLATKFFKENEIEALLQFVENLNETFVNKKCCSILGQARMLMKKDLHVVTKIEEKASLGKEDLEDLLQTKTNTNLKIDVSQEEELLPLPQGMSLNDGLFKFPTCQVSTSMIDLKALIDNVINEALEVKDDALYSGRLLVALRNVFEMYNDVLPVTHNESLKSFPLNSALGYNNCMYLAHECLQIFIPAEKLPDPLNRRPLTFSDLVPKLRQTGIEVFMAQMRRLRDQFRSLLRDSVTGIGQLDGSNLLPNTSEKCMKQVMHQMLHLKSLWEDTLPLSIYRRSIGTLLNSVVEELVQRVVVLEDIAADAAVQICTLFTTLQDKAPEQIFVIAGNKETSKGDIVRYVKKWNRFKELIIILNASMREIEDRWASGKGPLANEFTAEEVKRMIRALFQNTDRRAAVLSRIR